ncbi:MAG: DUF2183 domain-containing protein [Deltaproteobacteria bacterium]|jgi:hypothetical protein|nr:DUF2183 domain-containing protein [Deltaproteobacteria bacterium]MBW2537950.1 DUF2183 domain-containing protein [Deltaproteobacteria bacterium]
MPRRSASRAASTRATASPRTPKRRLSLVAIALVAVVLVVAALVGDRRTIKADERIILFPTTAQLSGDGRAWEIPIHGWVFEPELDDALRRAALAALRKGLGLDDVAVQSPVLNRRLQAFVVDNQRGKRITVEVAGVQQVLGPSDDDGHFEGLVRVETRQAKQSAKGDSLEVVAHAKAHPEGAFRGSVRLVGPTGVSVVSDIDDTIKVSQVADKKALVRNTLVLPFRAAPGMPELYRQWAERGVVFHYVSGSPWQLYEPLSQFIKDQRLPASSLSLKSFRLKDASVLDLFADPIRTKPPALERIFQAYPNHRFCLIGDSGERDPEVYGLMARRHPKQVACAYIRNVTDEDPDGPRFRDAFRALEPSQWKVFTDPADLPFPK